MYKLNCPQCNVTYFTAAVNSSVPCPSCNFTLSALDFERRIIGRLVARKSCELARGATRVPVKTVDISDTGVGIKMLGTLPFGENETVDIYLEGLNAEKKAQIVWTKRLYGISRAGLRFC